MKYYEVDFKIDCREEQRADVADVVAALAGEAGFESFEASQQGLCGYVQQDSFDPSLLDELLATLPFDDGVSVSYKVLPADEADWNAAWEQEGFDPVWVGSRLVIHDGRHLPHPAADRADTPVQIEIDAKLAFGTGNHQTTRLMCEALMDANIDGKTLLDCGTGTGILAIVALKFGARKAVGYDIDDWSAINAMHNGVLNHVDERLTVYQGDAALLDDFDETFDIVAANINRNILLADMPRMASRLNADGGTLLLSGFYRADAPLLVSRASELGLALVGQKEDEEWTLLRFQRTN